MSRYARNLSRLAVKSMRKAVLRVVEEHKKNGTPLSVWKDGKNIQISATSLLREDKQSTFNKSLKRNRLRRSV